MMAPCSRSRTRLTPCRGRRDVTAVSNNSWGPPDGPGIDRAPSVWEEAIEAGVTNGYGGRGVFYAWAGGNGHLEGDYSNLDELANFYGVTAVCAVNDGDVRSSYSEKGPNLWVCAPSNDRREDHRAIITVENSDRYYDEFGGTSAATPMVSGVAALMRSANKDLTWRDLKLIIAASARKNDVHNLGWKEGARKYGSDSDSDRYHFNHEYGFGVVDAASAVDLAGDWNNVPTLQSVSESSASATTVPPPGPNGSETVTTKLSLNTEIQFIEFVEISASFVHTSFRDMEIELVSPAGAVSKLTVPFDTRTDDDPSISYVPLQGDFRFGSARHLGENPNGEWILRLTDHFPTLGGRLASWTLRVYGHTQAVTVPGSATGLTATANGQTQIDLSWSAPSDNGGGHHRLPDRGLGGQRELARTGPQHRFHRHQLLRRRSCGRDHTLLQGIGHQPWWDRTGVQRRQRHHGRRGAGSDYRIRNGGRGFSDRVMERPQRYRWFHHHRIRPAPYPLGCGQDRGFQLDRG